ncbi:MAG: hypothetical protein KKD28_11690 [Chloroflexi bacterium]|nr:hypothetical protein [Chloroflexota bacterium]MBU1662120.1 hypothetical protein [Chloroflexota bacterium]
MRNTIMYRVLFLILLLGFTLACRQFSPSSTPEGEITAPPVAPSATLPPTQTVVVESETLPVPPTLTETTVSESTMPRWREYEFALSSTLLAGTGGQNDGLCEWQLLGQQDEKVYLWALCQVRASADGAATMAPAVLFIGLEGVYHVDIPRDGGYYVEDIKTLFPPELQTCALDITCFDGPAAMEHIDMRRADPSMPPLIVEQGVVLP